MIQEEIEKRKRKWLEHWLRRDCLLKDVIKYMIEGERGKRRRIQHFDSIKKDAQT